MGRGRAKAKQTKVARRLKYDVPDTDLKALQAELAGATQQDDDNDADYADSYESYAADADEDDDTAATWRP